MKIRSLAGEIDEQAEKAFAPLRGNPLADRVFYAASHAAEFSACWHVVSAAMAVASPGLRPHAARLTVALGVESVLVNAMIKPLFKRERPDLIEGAPKLRRPKTSSFPSGHASSAAMAAVLLSDALPGLRPVWWVASFIVGTSRVHARMHHGTDVAAGAALGTGLGFLVKQLAPLP